MYWLIAKGIALLIAIDKCVCMLMSSMQKYIRVEGVSLFEQSLVFV